MLLGPQGNESRRPWFQMARHSLPCDLRTDLRRNTDEEVPLVFVTPVWLLASGAGTFIVQTTPIVNVVLHEE